MDISLKAEAVPVIFIVFNRPAPTRRVIEAMRSVRPTRIYVAADGPRQGHPTDQQKCQEVREAVRSEIDWDCDLELDFAETNLGCGARVSSAITNGFQRFERAIILEDDTVPHPTFFTYCARMLERYADDERVGSVGGLSVLPEDFACCSDYYFSIYSLIWGWATWRRAWQHYDFEMSDWPERRGTSWVREIVGDPAKVPTWRFLLDYVHRGKVDTWDYQWVYTCWRQNYLSVLPVRNLIINVGFGADAMHTTEEDGFLARLTQTPFPGDPVHPEAIEANTSADAIIFERWWKPPSFINRLKGSFRSWERRLFGRRITPRLPKVSKRARNA